MTEEQLFIEQVSAFKTVTPEEAAALMSEQKGAILFIGRETCPYCRRFATKLSQVAKEYALTIHFLHSRQEATVASVDALRAKYNVPTVPGFLYASSEGVQVKCDSSMSEREIATFVGK